MELEQKKKHGCHHAHRFNPTWTLNDPSTLRGNSGCREHNAWRGKACCLTIPTTARWGGGRRGGLPSDRLKESNAEWRGGGRPAGEGRLRLARGSLHAQRVEALEVFADAWAEAMLLLMGPNSRRSAPAACFYVFARI